MNTQMIPTTNAVETALVMGDLSKLSADERLSYYSRLCESLGLNALTKPFEYITLNGRLTLYARKDATDQLRSIRNVSVRITGRDTVNDVFIVTAQAFMRQDDLDRTDESIGAVSIKGLGGDNLANALMKAETKAKRRVTLSICGLGMLDESELETIAELKNADLKPAGNQAKTQEVKAPEPPKQQAKGGQHESPKLQEPKQEPMQHDPAREHREALQLDILREELDDMAGHPAIPFEQINFYQPRRKHLSIDKLREIRMKWSVAIADYEKATTEQMFGGGTVQDYSAFAD